MVPVSKRRYTLGTCRVGATLAAKREHVGATSDLDSVVSEISQRVRLLDGLVRYRFGGNAELMGAWASARNVEGPPGRRSFRTDTAL